MQLFEQLMNEDGYWITFELGLKKLNGHAYFEEIQNRAKTILQALLDEEDELVLIHRVTQHIDLGKSKLPRMKRFIFDKKLIRKLSCETTIIHGEFESTTFFLPVKKSDLRIHTLVQEITGNMFIFNRTKNTLFHMSDYDHCVCEVSSFEKEALLPLYTNFRKWILDYNRIQIDRQFEEGLHSVFETEQQTADRIALNERLVEEMNMHNSLYWITKCNFIHSLEMPQQNVKQCVEEMTQTGFDIAVEQNKQDYAFVRASKLEALAFVDYQSELMALYAQKYEGYYHAWVAERAF